MTSTGTTPHAACIGGTDARIIDWMTQFGDLNFGPGQVEALIEAAGGGHNTGNGGHADLVDVAFGIASSRAGYLARLTAELARKVDQLTAERDDARGECARLEDQLRRQARDDD